MCRRDDTLSSQTSTELFVEERHSVAEALKAALWNLNDYRGPERRPVLRRLGRELGRMISTVIQSTDPGEVLDELSSYWHEEGLGEMNILSEEPWKLEIKNCYECLGLRYVGQTFCALKEGLLESVLAQSAGIVYSVTEEECCGTEGDRCLFRLES